MAYQVLNIKTGSTMGARESDENQRNWTKEQLHRQNMKPRHFYDPTRQNLNFEIDADGNVQPINTSPSVTQRLEDRCQKLGSKPPRKGAKMPRIRVLKIIVSGDKERMREMAFGDQNVDYTWNEEKTANTGLVRKKDIELWAKDVYDFMCRKFGKENVVGFDCHLDENSPHLHVAIVPVGPNGKVSYSGMAGDDRRKTSEYYKRLHTEFYKQVSSKWGLERGEDTSGRDVHHVEKAEYFSQLSRNIRMAERKIKSLRTMLENMDQQRSKLQRQLDDVRADIKAGNGALSVLEQKQMKLANDINALDEKIKDKQTKLLEANRQLAELKDKNEDMEISKDNAERIFTRLVDELRIDSGLMAKGAMFDAFYPIFREAFSNPEIMKAIGADSTTFDGLGESDLISIYQTALLAFIAGISAGDNVSVGGGGGETSGLKWRDEDDDETYAAFMRRCISASVKHHKKAVKPRIRK